jgi:hypothetical protein
MFPVGSILVPIVTLFDYNPFIFPFDEIWGLIMNSYIFFCIGGGVMAIIILALFLIYFTVVGVLKLWDTLNPFPEEGSTPKDLNIIMEYIKAKKEKICPIIEFIEEK